MAALNGRFGRVRIFLDGIEIDALNSRLNGQHDLSMVDLWHLEDATIETGADEVRVHLRSWRVTNTTPVTRIDIHTGDLQTNSYRGFYGRRFPAGQVVQLGGSHYATTNRRTAEAGDQTSLWGRLGIARKNWSADASILRSGRKFTERSFDETAIDDSLPTLDGLSTITIGRFAWGDPMSGPWVQVLGSTQSFSIRNPPRIVIDSVAGPGGGGPGGSEQEPDTLEVPNDTTRTRPQWVLTGGFNAGPLRLSALGRVRRSGETESLTRDSRRLRSGPTDTLASWGALTARQPSANRGRGTRQPQRTIRSQWNGEPVQADPRGERPDQPGYPRLGRDASRADVAERWRTATGDFLPA
jgi:hypothetical protein